jgi:hypothetical protein
MVVVIHNVFDPQRDYGSSCVCEKIKLGCVEAPDTILLALGWVSFRRSSFFVARNILQGLRRLPQSPQCDESSLLHVIIFSQFIHHCRMPIGHRWVPPGQIRPPAHRAMENLHALGAHPPPNGMCEVMLETGPAKYLAVLFKHVCTGLALPVCDSSQENLDNVVMVMIRA